MTTVNSYYIDFGENRFCTRKEAEGHFNDKGLTLPQVCAPVYHEVMGLYYPIVAKGTVIAYLNSQINKIPNGLKPIVFDSSNADFPSLIKTIKLLPQTTKALQLLPACQRICTQDVTRYNWSHKEGMKLRIPEVLKAMLLGYIELPSEDILIQKFLNACEDMFGYDYSSRNSRSTNWSLDQKIARVDQVLNNTATRLPYYERVGLSRTISTSVIRSPKAVSEDHVIKWRKPPKKSLWPWTLDHHWFEVQESPITLANYTYKALLGSGSHSKRDIIDKKYPVFPKQLVLEHGRKLLETFFEGVVRDKKPKEWGSVCHTLDCMRWASNYAYYAIPKLCLTLGVAPKFDESGIFQKFVPVAGNITLPVKKVYVEHEAIDVDNSNKLHTMVTTTMLFLYEFGLLSLENLQKNIGLVDAGEALEKDNHYVKINIGNNVVCCIPKDFSYHKAQASLLKFYNITRGETSQEELEEAIV